MTDSDQQNDATQEGINSRHKERMQRKKKVIDEQIAAADIERGIIILLTGTGKGKSSSAFGMVARSLGHGHKVGITQFIKGKWETGEEKFFASHPNVQFEAMGTGFTWNTQDRESDIQAAEDTWQHGLKMLKDPSINLVVLDEITYMYKFKYLDLDELLTALNNRPAHQHVVITGRPMPDELEAIADTISEVRNIKHAYKSGIKAQAGIDW